MTYDQKKIVEALRAFERGEIVVVMDDDGRENEGDLIVAAVHCTPEKMAFIVRHTSGIVCTPMTRERGQAPQSRRRWWPTTIRRTAPPSPSASISGTAPPPAFRPRTARSLCATSPTAMSAPPTSSVPATSSR